MHGATYYAVLSENTLADNLWTTKTALMPCIRVIWQAPKTISCAKHAVTHGKLGQIILTRSVGTRRTLRQNQIPHPDTGITNTNALCLVHLHPKLGQSGARFAQVVVAIGIDFIPIPARFRTAAGADNCTRCKRPYHNTIIIRGCSVFDDHHIFALSPIKSNLLQQRPGIEQ